MYYLFCLFLCASNKSEAAGGGDHAAVPNEDEEGAGGDMEEEGEEKGEGENAEGWKMNFKNLGILFF